MLATTAFVFSSSEHGLASGKPSAELMPVLSRVQAWLSKEDQQLSKQQALPLHFTDQYQGG